MALNTLKRSHLGLERLNVFLCIFVAEMSNMIKCCCHTTAVDNLFDACRRVNNTDAVVVDGPRGAGRPTLSTDARLRTHRHDERFSHQYQARSTVAVIQYSSSDNLFTRDLRFLTKACPSLRDV